MKKTLLTVYYFILILVLSSQAVYTVYRLSGTVGQGEKLRQLQHQQVALEKELQLLEETRYTKTALSSLDEEATQGFHAIGRPHTLQLSDSLASR